MGRTRTGTVFEQRGRWYAQVTFNGKRIARAVPPRKDKRPITEDYASKFLDGWLGLIERGEWKPKDDTAEVEPAEQTVTAYVTSYLEKQTYETKRDDERRVQRYLAPSALGKMTVGVVRPRHVLAFVEELQKLPSRRGGTLAARSVRNIYSVLQRAFARAVLEEVFPVSPCAVVADAGELPGVEDKRPGARAQWKYTREEVRALCTDSRVPYDRRVLYTLLFLTGARFGEIAALRWGDFEEHATPLARLTIAHSHQSSTRKIKGTKTGAIRLVPVHPTLRTVLVAWREHQQPKGPESWMIPNKDGAPRASSGTHKQVTADLERLGIKPRGMQQHAMRHTLISLARADGARGDLLKWVTHTPPRAQLDQYTTPSWESLCAEVAKLNLDLDNASNSASRKDEGPGTF